MNAALISHLIRCTVLCAVCVIAGTRSFSQIPKLNSFPSAKPTVYLDFDGQTVMGTLWNWDSTIHARPAGLSAATVTEIFNRIAEDFRIFNLNITTDVLVFNKAPVTKRARVILTPTSQWYGGSGGVAYIGSFVWGDDTPAWVFTALLDNNAKYIGEAASHEIGHTLGLQHQSTYTKGCSLVTEYAEGRGEGEIGWAPIMGVGYYRNLTTWTLGATIEGCRTIQNDISIISKGQNNIGIRNDDYGNATINATNLVITNNKFAISGIVTSALDKDYFRIDLVKKSLLKSSVLPYHIKGGNDGANLDLQLTIIKVDGDTIEMGNPKSLLGASVDTLLNSGTYYLSVDGIGNQNVSDYGSVGAYTLTGSIQTTTAPPVLLKGGIQRNSHVLTWDSENRESITRTYLESSLDGIRFLPLREVPAGRNTYTSKPTTEDVIHYRVRMLLPDGSSYYSDTVHLSTVSVSLLGNMVRDNIQVQASGEYSYQLIDELGRIYQSGRIVQGINNISINHSKKGLLLMKVFNNNRRFNYRLMKQ